MRTNSVDTFLLAGKELFFVSLFATIATITGNCSAEDRTVKVTLSTALASTADKVEITESTKILADHKVTSIARVEKRIGIYHRGLKRFVLWNGNLTRGERQRSLPKSRLAPHGIPLKDFGDGRVGVQYEFNAPDPGVFIVNTTWTLSPRAMSDQNHVERKGNPVLLFVEPGPDYDDQDKTNDGPDDGPSLQEFLEKKFDKNPDEFGVLLPSLN